MGVDVTESILFLTIRCLSQVFSVHVYDRVFYSPPSTPSVISTESSWNSSSVTKLLRSWSRGSGTAQGLLLDVLPARSVVRFSCPPVGLGGGGWAVGGCPREGGP